MEKNKLLDDFQDVIMTEDKDTRIAKAVAWLKVYTKRYGQKISFDNRIYFKALKDGTYEDTIISAVASMAKMLFDDGAVTVEKTDKQALFEKGKYTPITEFMVSIKCLKIGEPNA